MKPRKYFRGIGLALLGVLSAAAQATTLFSNFGAGGSYHYGLGSFVGDPVGDGASNYAQASAFMTNVSAELGSIEIALSNFDRLYPQVDAVTVSLLNSGSNVPGSTVLERFTIAPDTLGLFGDPNAPLVLNSTLHPLLTIGTQYWLAVSSTINNVVVWNFSDLGFSNYNGESQSLDGGATWAAPNGATAGAFAINAFGNQQPVPEPATLALLLAGVLGLAGLCVRRRLEWEP